MIDQAVELKDEEFKLLQGINSEGLSRAKNSLERSTKEGLVMALLQLVTALS